MNSIRLHTDKKIISAEISISGSKSESNRLLILNSLYGNPIQLKNISDSEDTQILQNALKSNAEIIDIHHAGTAMRFLTAYFSMQAGKEIILMGSDRMKQRPIGILVDALRTLGAEISYVGEEGFPPLKIMGKKLDHDFVELNSDVSSQFITALMLISGKIPNGLTLQLNGKITSLPYLEMTIQLINQLGLKAERKENKIRIFPAEKIEKQDFTIESDWSSVSYFYAMAALSESADLKINSYKKLSLQGDSKLVEIYRKYFGVETQFIGNQIQLQKKSGVPNNPMELDLNAMPDIAQTVAVTCAGLKTKCKLTELETLKIKETDRLVALQNELFKVGAVSEITESTLEIIDFIDPEKSPLIKTYEDHRMAMSFTAFAMVQDLEIENPEVVKKSYPDFWLDAEKAGIQSIKKPQDLS